MGTGTGAGADPARPFTFRLGPVTRHGLDRLLATLTVTVAPEHYLYRERTGVRAATGSLSATWPPSQRMPDPFDGNEIDVFGAGTHEVSLVLRGAAGFAEIPLIVDYHGCSSVTCLLPGEKTLPLAAPVQAAFFDAPPDPIAAPVRPAAPLPVSGAQEQEFGIGEVVTPGGGSEDFGRALREWGLLWVLLVAFAGGFLVSLTPCVYPMIPITLSIIGGRQENTSFARGLGLSVSYVAGMSLTYALLGLVVAMLGAHVRGILQGAWFQLAMAGFFVLLALSMFDVFLLQVPEALRRKAIGVKRAGLGGVFVLGMVAGLVASPCVAAPLAGILAFIAASGSLVLGFSMLLAFAWGMGLILVVIGTFSGSLNALPKAGDWMVKVKEFYGFLLLGAALSFAQPFIGSAWACLLAALLLAAFAGFLGLFGPVSAEAALSERVSRCLGVVTLAVACTFAVSSVAQWGGGVLPDGADAHGGGVRYDHPPLLA